MKIGIDLSYFKKKAKEFNDLSVTVTISDQDNKFYRSATSKLSVKKWGKTRVASRKQRKPKIKLRTISKRLDSEKGIYSKAIKKAKNTDLMNLADNFAQLYLSDVITENDKKRLQNISSAIVRNNMTARRFGRNRRGTIEQKGFDSWGIDTGQTINSIKGFFRS